MKSIQAKLKEGVKLSIKQDAHWRILASLAADLGYTVSTPSSPFVDDANIDHKDVVITSLRNRGVKGVENLLSHFEPQCILRNLSGRTNEAYAFFARYQISSFLKKFPLSSGDELKTVALRSFTDSETTCRLFNTENYKALLAMNDRHPDFLGVVEEIKSDILGLIGDGPNVNSMYYNAKHGPGTAVGNLYKNGKTTSFYKWSNLPYSVTELAEPYAKEAITQDARWIGALDDWYRRANNLSFYEPICIQDFWNAVLVTVPGSRITTVPKSYKTDRTIAIEPALNVYFQLGVDSLLRRRLKHRWNLDIDDQGVNQDAALRGSVDNTISTIDLSKASDTISLKLCELLLPPLWYSLLLDLRSPSGWIDDRLITFEKISSMGNGYTFALETLIFGALARCAVRRCKVEKFTAVYGDDIAVPSKAANYLITLLNLCGFQINKDKTFIDGPFRESCGKDFFLGYNVRPVFLKKPLRTIQDVFYIHNALWALERRLPWQWGVSFSKTLSYIRSFIPKFYLDNFYGPVSESMDTYLFSERRVPRDSANLGYMYRITPVPIKISRRYRDFFFVKLMSNLKGVQPKLHKWERKRSPNSGNAFDIVRRDSVQYTCTKCSVW